MRIKYLNNIDEIRLAEFEPDQILIDSQTGKIYSDRAGIRLQPSSVGREVSSTRETFISDREDSSIVINDNNDIAVITNEGRFELNSILIEQQEEDRWLLRFGLYKKRFYLYSVVNEEVIISDIAPPSITSGTYNFDTEEASAIIINSPSGYTWTIEKPTPGANEYLIASSFLFVSSERLLTIGSALIGDTPSKVLNREKRKRDLILFKQESIGTLPGRLMFDFKTNRLIELETDSLNGWSSNFIQPTEENETYVITVALNSNDVPSIIDTPQWTQPIIANPSGRDGVDAISYDIVVSSEVIYKDADTFDRAGRFKNNLTIEGKKTQGETIENFGYIRFRYGTGSWNNLTSPDIVLTMDTTSTFEFMEFELFATETDRTEGENRLDYHKIPVVLKGFGAVQVALDNDHAGVREDAEGQRTPVSISTNVVVYENHEIVNDLWTLETTAVAFFGASLVSIIDNGSLKSISIDSENITEDAGFVDVKLTRTGYDDIIKRFSFTLTTDGDDGEDARSVVLSGPTDIIYNKDWANPTPNPTSLTFTATSSNYIAPRYRFRIGGGSWNSFGASNTTTLNGGTFSSETSVLVEVEVKEDTGTEHLMTDSYSIRVTRQPKDGESITGPDGSTVVNGTVFLKAPATPTPDTPTGSYNKTNNTYTFSEDWSRTIEFEAGSQDTYWRSDFSGIGDTDIITLSFTIPEPTINFSGLVTFTDINEPLSLENTNVTSIEGGLLSTVNIISSDVISGSIPKMRIGLNDQVISIGQATEGYEQNGIFLGYDSNDPKMSLVGSEGHLKWVNSKLDIEGDLGGNLGKIEIGAGINNPGPTGIRISEDGILGFKNGTTTFSIQAGSGDATFNGEITSTSGNIGGWNIHTNYLRAPSGVGIMKIRSGSNDVEYWSGPSSDDGAGYPTINGASKIGFNSQALGMYTRYTSTSRERIELMPGGIYYYSEGSGSGNTEKLLIQSQKNIELVSTGGSIWVRGNGSDLVQLRLGLGTLVSSKIAKKDIFELNQNDINDFIEKVEIKEFSYKKDNKKSISLIIEDEEEKNNPFSEILFTRDNKREKYNKWDDVPEWLKEYKNTPNLTEENGIYYFNPKTYDLSVLSSITLASVKQQNKKIKELENKIEELYKIIENLTKN